jgi:hypothetical protein
VWYEVVNGNFRTRQILRAAQPKGPSVAIWMQFGLNWRKADPILWGVASASDISG